MNNIQDIFFHIHYCNGSKLKRPGEFNPKIARSLPHDELIYVCNGIGSFKIKNRKYPVRKVDIQQNCCTNIRIKLWNITYKKIKKIL